MRPECAMCACVGRVANIQAGRNAGPVNTTTPRRPTFRTLSPLNPNPRSDACRIRGGHIKTFGCTWPPSLAAHGFGVFRVWTAHTWRFMGAVYPSYLRANAAAADPRGTGGSVRVWGRPVRLLMVVFTFHFVSQMFPMLPTLLLL